MRVAILDVNYKKFISDSQIRDNLEVFYNILNTDSIEIVNREVGGKIFRFIVDDEGAFRDNAVISCTDINQTSLIFGNAIIANIGKGGQDFESLTDDDMTIINNAIVSTRTEDGDITVLLLD